MNRRRSAVLLTALIGLLASLLVLFANPATADACSIAPPQLEVWPNTGLRPGDAIKVRGTGFHDVVWHDVPTVDAATGAVAVQPQRVAPAISPSYDPNSCAGLELVPQVVVLAWIGPDERPVQRVMGPDFELEMRVPDWAQPGWAALSANGVLAEMKIGDDVPEPCPLVGANVDPARWPDHCPTPCPQVLDASGMVAYPPCPDPCDVLARPAIDAHWCPEPCPIYAHGDAAAQVLPPHCPDPCAGNAANAAVWCPEPCPTLAQLDPDQVSEERWKYRWPHCPWPCDAVADGALSWWPCPRPCPAIGDIDPTQVTEDEWKRRLPHCPWPCDAVAGGALSWWPCPRPCPAIGDIDPTQVTEEEWKRRLPHCPWPCDVLYGVDATDDDLRRSPCPWPCPVPARGAIDADARHWPCPDPCAWPYGDDVAPPPVPADAEALSYWCPDPCAWPYGDDMARPPVPADAEALSYWCPDPCQGVPVEPPTGETPPDAEGHAIWCPHPLPVPEPVPCAVDPDGTTWCEGDAVAPTGTTTPGAPIGAAPPGVVADTSTPAVVAGGDDAPLSSLPARPVVALADLAPPPRIDFDGCRVDGPSPCFDVVYGRALQTLRRMVGMFPGR